MSVDDVAAFICWNDDNRLLIDRLFHRAFDGAHEARSFSKYGAVGESGEAHVLSVQKAYADAFTAKLAGNFRRDRSRRLSEVG